MGAERVAVVGVGQTKYTAVRGDVSLPGLLREATFRALEDAQMTLADIDAIVIGKAPDFFEGIMVPEYSFVEALGAVGKPIFRVHTAGSVSGSTAIVASGLIESGVHERVLTIGWEMQSCSEAMWALSFNMPFQQQLVAGAGGYFAPYIRQYIARSNAPDDTGVLVALKDRQNALKNPYAHLHEHDISYESVKDSLMLWDPIRYSETCPSSDGAIALILTNEAGGDAASAEGRSWNLVPLRTSHGRRSGSGFASGWQGLRRRRLPPSGNHQPARADRRSRDVCSVLLVRAHVARELGLCRGRHWLATHP